MSRQDAPLTLRQAEVLAWITDHPYCTATEVERALNLYRGGFRWGMEGLIARGLIERFENWSEEFGGRFTYYYRRIDTDAEPNPQ